MRMEITRSNLVDNGRHRDVRINLSEINPDCPDFHWNLFYTPVLSERQRVRHLVAWSQQILDNIIVSMEARRRPPPAPQQYQVRRGRVGHVVGPNLFANYLQPEPDLMPRWEMAPPQPLPQFVIQDDVNNEREENPVGAPVEP